MRNTILIFFMVLSSASFADDSKVIDKYQNHINECINSLIESRDRLFKKNTTKKITFPPVSCTEMLIAYEEYLSNETN